MRNSALDDLTKNYEGCTLAAFADLSVGITLRAAAGTTAGQEALDQLCADARALYAALPDPGDLIVRADAAGTLVFLRAPGDETGVLLARCDGTVPLDAFVADARTCFGEAR